MGKSKLFDNIMQVIHVSGSLNGVTIVSTEIDLELPRGFIAKIHKIKFEWDAVMQAWASGEKGAVNAALVLDPDDAISVGFPQNSVEHDVIAEYNCEVMSAAATVLVVTNPNEWVYFDETEDVITARNMRFNFVCSSIDFNTDSQCECTVYYTLEKIEDAQIMELLDIL